MSWKKDELCLLGIIKNPPGIFFLLLLAFPMVIVSLYSSSCFCCGFVFFVFFRMFAPSTHEHMVWCMKNRHTSEHKDKHIACVPVLMNLSCGFLGFYFESEAIMYPTPLSIYKPHLLRNWEMAGEWSSAQWMPVWKPWDAVLALGPFHSLLGCKKSSLEKCGCNSMRITLA